jgi:uncharacterized phage-associated protein
MTEQLSLEEITALLLDEHQKAYSNSIPPKALHKVLYFAEQEFEREHLDVELPIFWYIYGAVVKTSNSGVRVTSTEHGQRVACDTDISDITASDVTIRKARRALSRSLDQYYDLGLDSLTDKMYREAPYDIQRTYRRLDKQLEVATDDEQTTLFGRKNEEPTRETLCEFVEHFPLTEFPEYEDDLYIWYRLMSAEIDSDDYNPSRAQRLAKMFWRLFCLELACRNNHGLSREEIAEEVNADSISDAKSQLRSKFLALEREKARANASDSEEALKAAEAFVVPFLDVSIPV